MKPAQDILTSTDKFHINLGLDRMYKVLSLLDNPQKHLKFIHIAGTNGKGSTCAIVNQILIENNLKTGLFTSPHLFKYNERIKINNCEISDKDFDYLVNYVVDISNKNNIHLTEFEILTTVAFLYFKKHNVDIVVLETGLGGRLDATNVIDEPLVCAITDIDLEHTERLGNSIDKIAFEKAGIIKNNCKTVVVKGNKGLNIIKKYSKNLIIKDEVELPLNFKLRGNHQKRNLALALGIIECLPYKIKNIKNALLNVEWKFRMEYDKNLNQIIDGAHNPSGIKVLRNYLDENFNNSKKQIIFGCLKNKKYEEMLEILIKDDDEFLYVDFNHNNALKFDDLPEKFKKRAKKFDKKLLKNDYLKIYCGSLYMLGEIFMVK